MKVQPQHIDAGKALDQLAEKMSHRPLLSIETTKAHLDQIRDMQQYYPEIHSHFQAIVKQLTGLVRLNTKTTASCD